MRLCWRKGSMRAYFNILICFTKEYKVKVNIAIKLELIVDWRGDVAKDLVKIEKQLLRYTFFHILCIKSTLLGKLGRGIEFQCQTKFIQIEDSQITLFSIIRHIIIIEIFLPAN